MKYLKINKILMLILISLFAGISCKKEIFRSKLTGTVRHFYTRLPISGIPVKLSHGSGGWLYGHQGSDGTVTTDGMGTFFFKIREERNSAYSVSVDHLTSLDSMQNEWKFLTEGVQENITDNTEILLRPSGIIDFYIKDSTLANIGADTVVILSEYTSDTIFKGRISYHTFYLEPSLVHHFTYIAIKNKQEKLRVLKDVYVKNKYVINLTQRKEVKFD